MINRGKTRRGPETITESGVTVYDIIVRSSGDGGMTIELRGELDLASVDELRITLDNVASLCKPTTV